MLLDAAEDEAVPEEAAESSAVPEVPLDDSPEVDRLSVSELEAGWDEIPAAALDGLLAEDTALSAGRLSDFFGADSCDAEFEAYAKALSDETPDVCAPDAF